MSLPPALTIAAALALGSLGPRPYGMRAPAAAPSTKKPPQVQRNRARAKAARKARRAQRRASR